MKTQAESFSNRQFLRTTLFSCGQGGGILCANYSTHVSSNFRRNLLKTNADGPRQVTQKSRVAVPGVLPGFSGLPRKVYSFPRPMPSWYEKRIRRYEQMRFDQEPKRRTLPFAWGIEHIGGDPAEPILALSSTVTSTDAIAHSDDWYSLAPADDYALADNVLTFTSAIASPWPANNRVHAQLFPRTQEGTGGGRARAMERALGGAAERLPLAERSASRR